MTDDIMSLLATLPKFKGPHLLSLTSGEKPISFGTKIKAELDRRMLVRLQALARERGQDPAEAQLPHFVNHDLRRTVRSRWDKPTV